VSYADQPRTQGPRDADSGAYRKACAVVKSRARGGEWCWFYGRAGHEACPGSIDLGLHWQDRWAFTAHHLHRRMDGGVLEARPEDMAPAHRACNSRDGLLAQNAKRGHRQSRVVVYAERHSREW
jgi:hypothetical protein